MTTSQPAGPAAADPVPDGTDACPQVLNRGFAGLGHGAPTRRAFRSGRPGAYPSFSSLVDGMGPLRPLGPRCGVTDPHESMRGENLLAFGLRDRQT